MNDKAAPDQKPAVEKAPPESFLKGTNLDAVGRHVSQAIVNWFSNPETLKTLLDFFTKNRKAIRSYIRANSRRRRRRSTSSSKKPCSEEGCEDPAVARGLCARHYSRLRYQEKKKDRPEAKIRGVGTCSADGCDKPVHARGLCGSHFMEWVRTKRKDTNNASDDAGAAQH